MLSISSELQSRFEELCIRAQRAQKPVFTHFLDPAAGQAFCISARKLGLETLQNGGCQDAERAVYSAFAYGCEPYEDEWPVCIVQIRWDARFADVSHRDVLGAVLALGFERDRVGDIRIGQEEAYLLLHKEIASYVVGTLEQIGRASVKLALVDEVPIEADRGEEITVNCASARLDAVLAAVTHLSRAVAQEFIRSGRVLVNWQECEHVDRELSPGDMVTMRGKGRFRLKETLGSSKKGRYFYLVEYFGTKP